MNRWERDNQRTIEYFTDLAGRYGADVRTVDWGSQQSQRTRFQVLSEVGDLRGSSVLDVGCGLGDLYTWLRERNLDVRYTGIDITPRMIELARSTEPEGDFRVNDLLGSDALRQEFDFVVSSGIFYHRSDDAYEFLEAMVGQMFARCRRAVAFNTLSGWAPGAAGDEFHADPVNVLRLCHALTDRLTLRHDYHPRDFTVYLYKATT